jgi:hypothetical protein
MLYADGGGLRRGLLIDYDYAAELEGDSDHSVDTERTVRSDVNIDSLPS